MSNSGLAAILCGVVLAGTGIGAWLVLSGGDASSGDAVLVPAQSPTTAAPRIDDDDDDDDEHDVTVTIDEVSDAARATILEYADDGTITEIEMSNWRGEVVYEIEVYWDDAEVDFMVGEDGAFLGYEDEDGD